jgi:protein LTV1
LYRSQRDVAGADDGSSGDAGVILWPSPGNSKATDQKVLLGKSSSNMRGDGTLQVWKSQLSQAGLVDEYDYDKHMKPITGTGVFFDTSGKRGVNALADVRSMEVQEDLVREVDRQLESIALTADCMDEDIAHALFDDFDEAAFEELNDEFVLDAAQVMEGDEAQGFDFAAHIKGLMEKARMESKETPQLGTIHEKGREDQDFFSRAKPLGDRDDEDEDEFANIDGDYGDGDWNIDGTPGVVPKLNDVEEKALCDKFEETLLEYDSDDIGEGADDEEAMGLLPLEGDKQVEAALDEYLEEKRDEIFMAGGRHYLAGENGTQTLGGSGFAALVGTKMVPLKNLDDNADVQGDIRPISDVLGEADEVLGVGRHAPPAEEIFIDGKSYFSEKMRNPWDCESILSTYSNLDNNPVTIGTESGRRRRKQTKKGPTDEEGEQRHREHILLSDKTGLPLGVLPVREEEEDDYGGETFMSVNKGVPRSKNECKEEKHLRKLAVKKERQVARMQKKMMKEVFNDEFTKRQHEVLQDDVGGTTVFRF